MWLLGVGVESETVVASVAWLGRIAKLGTQAVEGAGQLLDPADQPIVGDEGEDGEEGSPQRGWRGEGAILVLRVEGPRAIEVQHRSGQILERVNSYFGYRAIAELRILQAPVTRAPARSPAPPQPVIDAEALPASASIEDQGLRAALSRLGSATRARLTRG